MSKILVSSLPGSAPKQPPRFAPGFALWELGFRPFYLIASVFAVASIALWALQLSGAIAHPYLAGPVWHAHEMVFGFALAVVVGFLLTAGRNWTGLPTTTPATLKALVALWIAGRVLVLTPLHAWAAVVTVAFPLAAAATLAGPFVKARNRRNYLFLGVLMLFALADACVHLAVLGIVDVPAQHGLQLALDLMLIVMAVIGGRVIPMFTNNAVQGAGATRHPWVERVALGSLPVLAIADAAGAPAAAIAVVAAAAALAHGLRWALWRPWSTLRVPIVWILHAAYAWIAIHLALRAAAEASWIAPGIAIHALTVGAIGGLTLGMMTRTARGHTARPLNADRWEVICYGAILLAAIVRVVGPLALPEGYLGWVLGSAALWAIAFGTYALRYWPILSRSRLDGLPG